MPRPMARILSRRADGAPPAADAAPADQATTVLPAGAEQPTQVAPALGEQTVDAGGPPEVVPVEAAPEEVAPGDVAAPAPSFRDRGRLRRRLRYLRRVRELAFRDLGGLVFDLDRFGRERPDLIELKLAGLRSIDGELRAIEAALGDEPPVEELREPGVTACAHCGALHGSEARFCPACGTAAGTPRFTAIEAPAPTADAAPPPSP